MQTIGIDATLLLGACLPLIGIGLLFYLRKPAPAVDALVIAETSNAAAPQIWGWTVVCWRRASFLLLHASVIR
jgi:hypothetical protein